MFKIVQEVNQQTTWYQNRTDLCVVGERAAETSLLQNFQHWANILKMDLHVIQG